MGSTRLRILEVVPYFYPAWAYGGIPRVVYELSQELARRGHDVTVYTTDVLDRGSRCEYSGRAVDIDGVKVRYFKNLGNALAYHLQVYLPVGFSAAIRRTIDDFDVIHMHGHRHFLNDITRHYAVAHAIPYVVTAHGTVMRIERRFTAKAVYDLVLGGRVLRDAAAFTAVSASEIEQYERMGVTRGRVRVIYNGVDPDSFKVLPPSGEFKARHNITGKKVILYLGKITPRKGIDFLVRAFSVLKRDDAVLVVAGNDMGFKAKVEEVVSQRGVSDRVIFTGLLTGRDKLAAYRDADVLVYPATYEIFGLVPFEAMLCGTPVIVTDDCGCGEIIAREDIGYIVKYNDDQGLAQRIEEVLTDTASATKKVERGIGFIKKELAWTGIAGQYEDLYRELSTNRATRVGHKQTI